MEVAPLNEQGADLLQSQGGVRSRVNLSAFVKLPPPVRICCRDISKTFGARMAAGESQPAPLDVEEFGLQRRVRSRFCFALGFSGALVAFPNLLAQWLEHDTPPTTEHSRPILH